MNITLSSEKASIVAASEHMHYVVGVVRNGALHLYDTNNVPNTKARHHIDESAPSQPIKRKDMEARNELGMAFGSKKKKQDIRATTENVIQLSSLKSVENAMEKEMAAVADLHEEVKEEAVDRVVPKYNPDATRPADVYDINDIIPPEEWQSLRWRSLTKLSTLDELRTHVNKVTQSTYIVDRLHTAIQNKQETRIKQLVYLTFLLKVYHKSDKSLTAAYREDPDELSNLNKALGGPPDALTLVTRFNEKVEREGKVAFLRSAKLKDKLLAYIFALALTVDDYHIDPSMLAEDLKLATSKALDILKELGCSIEQRTKDGEMRKFAKLTVPLKFPKRTR